MEKEERLSAFQELMYKIGNRLNKEDMNNIEVFEVVPQEHREKGGMKLLEYLQKQGKCFVWRTSQLREMLRKYGRCDLADAVKEYQRKFPDLPGNIKGRG